MPAKKAAGEASASPKNVKADKPVEEKKGGQAGGPRGGQRGNQSPQIQSAQAPAQAAQGAQGQRPRPPISTDPAEAAIQHKMNAIEANINKLKDELNKIDEDVKKENARRRDYVEAQKKLREQMRTINTDSRGVREGRVDSINEIKELKRLQGLKREEAKAIRNKLPRPPGDDTDAYAKRIDEDIRALEKGLASSAYSLQEEKKKVEQISELQKSKRIYKEYMAVVEKMNADAARIKELEAKLDETKSVSDDAKGKLDGVRKQIDDLDAKIDAAKQKGDETWQKRGPINEKIVALRKDLNDERKNLDTFRTNRKEENDKKWKLEKERQHEEYLVRQKQREERQAEREKKEEAKTPYEDEIYLCDALVGYLETLLPPKQKETSATTAAASTPTDVTVLKKDDDEGEFAGKKKAGKKQKQVKATQDLKHNVEVFLQFETVSLSPPSKLSDVEATIAELKTKKTHYEQLSAAKTKERQEKKAADDAAAAAKEGEGESSKTPATNEATAE